MDVPPGPQEPMIPQEPMMWSLVARFVERLVDGLAGGQYGTVAAGNRSDVGLDQGEKFFDRLEQIGGRRKQVPFTVGQTLGRRIDQSDVGDDAIELVLDELCLRVVGPAGVVKVIANGARIRVGHD